MIARIVATLAVVGYPYTLWRIYCGWGYGDVSYWFWRHKDGEQ